MVNFQDLRGLIVDYYNHSPKSSPFFASELYNFWFFFNSCNNVRNILGILHREDLLVKFDYIAQILAENNIPLIGGSINFQNQRISDFFKQYGAFFEEIEVRVNGLLMKRVFMERLNQMDVKYTISDPLDQKLSSKIRRPDTIIELDGHKIAIEFKCHHCKDEALGIDKNLIRDYNASAQKVTWKPNPPDCFIFCLDCHREYRYSQDCHPFTRQLLNDSIVGLCFSCIKKTIGNQGWFMADDGVIETIRMQASNINEVLIDGMY